MARGAVSIKKPADPPKRAIQYLLITITSLLPLMLRQSLHQLSLHTRGEGFTDISAALDREIGASGLATGLANLACMHTSCSLTINENADPRVLVDLAAYLGIPEKNNQPGSLI